jgi:hypothetical protein
MDAHEQILKRALVDQASRIAGDHWLRDPKCPIIEWLIDHA